VKKEAGSQGPGARGLVTPAGPGLRDALEQGRCHLWFLRPGAISGPHLERGLLFLSSEETARHSRFLMADAARTFLSARILLRSVLSLYGALPPAAWRFDTNPWGRPHIASQDSPPGLVFNLSHKPGLVTCLVGSCRDLGVDVEDTSVRRAYLLEIASRFFSPCEAAALHELPDTKQAQRFFQLWTLKEAYIKARGRGLSLGLSRFSFSVDEAASAATVRFDDGFDDDRETWDFGLFHPDDRHLIATAVRRTKAPLRIEIADGEEVVARALER
jgi:4'-phosphopantetheinyl transferase